MKKITVLFSLLLILCAFLVKPALATDTAQNVLVSCLDAYVVNDPGYTEMLPFAGVKMTAEQVNYFKNHDLFHKFGVWKEPASGNMYSHVAMLKNKVDGTTTYKFVADKPVSILRQHLGNFECATDMNRVSTCPEGPVPTVANLGYGMEFRVMDKDKNSVLPSTDGSLTVNHVMSWTEQFLDQSFFGMQVLTNMTGTAQTEAIGAALKLATFTPASETPEAATNCVTVQWDPYGRVIDAKTLEPVQNVQITLYNMQGSQKVQTVNAQNPLFTNPYKTVADGTFNFAVPAGTYYLSPQTTDFTFPADQATLNQVIANLKSFDATGTYVDTTKLLTSADEAIVEKEGMAEQRDIVLVPNNPNYAGSPAVIQTKNTMRDKSNYVISGMVSHPKTIVRALINGVVKTQVQTDIDRLYSLSIPESALPAGFDGEIDLEIQKMPLVASGAQSAVVKESPVQLMPTFVSGFAVDAAGKVMPNAIVEVIVPKLGNMSYAATAADGDGFFVLDKSKIPSFAFELKFTDPQKPTDAVKLSPKEFATVNKAYFAETKRNMYQASAGTQTASSYKPSAELVSALKQSFVRTVPTMSSPTVAPTVAATGVANNFAPMIIIVAFIVLIGLGAAVVLTKKQGTRL